MNYNSSKKILLLILILFTHASAYSQTISNPEITAEEIKDHISFLASDKLKGRDSGTQELFAAAVYISDEFKNYGLEPLFGDNYLQEFPFIKTIELTDKNNLSFTSNGKEVTPKLNEDYITVPFSGNAEVSSQLVFAGFGISASELEYDDYNGIDVKDKIVIVFRNTPEPNVAHSGFDAHSPLRKKASVARDKGAAGIIFINPYVENKTSDDLVEFSFDRGGSISGFAAVSIKQSFIEQFVQSEGINLKEVYDKIIETKKTSSFELKNTSAIISTEVKEVEAISWNVGGYIEGTDPELKNEVIIIGAHFDHLGMGGEGSLYRGDEPQIHNGADDNASGTTGVIELAEKFAAKKDKLKRSIAFFTFSGEELGLLGSNYLVNNLPFPVEDAITMVNMDMIGRLKDSSLIIYGTGTSSNWKDILNNHNKYGFKLTFNDEGFGPSDHSSFYGAKIPVLFFFTGTHEDYHKPSDDTEKINFAAQENILNYVYNIVADIDQNPERPDYLLVEKKQTGQMFARKVYVGTVPDFASNVDGYKISGVSEGSPAQLAGLQGGDIIISFGGKKISNIYDFTYALGDFVPGDEVDVIVKRGEEEITYKIKLASK
ncbi:MAG: M28 family peptidase [Ignavibacteriaceae bacterium]|nr:M28 family peptidase [Ignavibacteriaceae bacterium]